MKRLSLLLLLSVVCLMQAAAQQFGITGRITDNGTPAAPLPLARVQLLSTDSTELKSVSTGNNGRFSFAPKQSGTYIVRVSFLGFRTIDRNVQLTAKKPTAALGDLQLQPADVQLGEATVSALSRQLTIKADTFVYNSAAFQVPEGASLAALVKQLPGLSTDADGNLTFQGKAVSSILINGKPLFGDTQTALADLPAAAVQNVKAYDKTSDDAEFTGEIEVDKATVLDLTIKKEYMASWNLNLDAGGGTHDRWTGRAFASTFTDRRRLALYVSGNNISENQRVDDNGNWSHWGSPDGKYVFRNVGGMFSWDNGRKNTEAGFFRGNAQARLYHNNRTRATRGETENFLTSGSHHSYSESHERRRDRGFELNGSFIWNLDSMNRITASAHFNLRDYENRNHSETSEYTEAPSIDHPASGLMPPQLNDELAEIGVYSNNQSDRTSKSSDSYSLNANYHHRFSKKGRSISVHYSLSGNNNDGEGDALRQYLYFRPDAPKPEQIYRQYRAADDKYLSSYAFAQWLDNINDHLNYELAYQYRFTRNEGLSNLYQLDRYAEYNAMFPGLGIRPTTQDSLDFVRDVANSFDSRLTEHRHRVYAGLRGRWDKLEFSTRLNVSHSREHLDYERDEKTFAPTRHEWYWEPQATLRWKPKKGRDILFSYYGSTELPGLMDLLPITDSSDEMNQQTGNPDLKKGWYNRIYLRTNFNNERTGASYNLYGAFNQQFNRVINIQRIDENTGATYSTKDNTNGIWSSNFGFSTQQLLDTARHWTLDAGLSGRYNRSKSFVGSLGDALGLSVVHSSGITPQASLRYRSKTLSAVLRAMYTYEGTRYEQTPQYDQDGHTYELTLSPQWELPCGLRLSADMTYYGRRGYASDILNHDQWLLNASVAYSFLKSKALTVQLQAIDLLQQRTNEWNWLSPTHRTFSRTETFLSYVLVQVSYKLNIKKGDKRR